MKILDLVKCAPALYKSGTAIHLIGPPGVGKSDVVKNEFRAAISNAVGEELGFHDVLLPTVDAPDVRGFLVPTKGDDGRPTSFYTRSGIMPSTKYIQQYPRGIMFLDERNSADQLTQKACAPVILDRRFGDEQLPPGWLIVSASNRMEDRAGVGKAMTHMVNRERTINLQSDIESWAVWAESKGVHPMLVAFAKARPGVIFPDAVPKTDGPFCTARSFVSAARLLADLAGVDDEGGPVMNIPCDSLTAQLIQGDIGEQATSELMAHLKLGDQLPTIQEILDDPDKAKIPDPKSLSAAYAAAQMCLHFAEPKKIDKLWTYAMRLPREIQVSTAQSLVGRGGGILLNSKKMTEWLTKNQALINTSTARR